MLGLDRSKKLDRLDKTKTISIIGAGLTGSMMAIILARKGFQVEIFERRPDMRSYHISAGRSINLAISERGLYALERLSLKEKVLQNAVPMLGRMMHARDGAKSYQAYSPYPHEFINSVSRAELNKLLMSEAEASGKVKIFFEHELIDSKLDEGVLEFRVASSGKKINKQADVILGTDGSASILRTEILSASSGSKMTREKLSHSYKELHIAPALGENKFKLDKNALHIWPRSSFMMIALPNIDGSFTVTLFLQTEGSESFAALNTAQKVREFFSQQFADVVPLLDNLERDFFENPTGELATIKCFPWSVGSRALIFGDASHAVVPFYGQGMNCCFEDCVELDRLIDEGTSQGWQDIFDTFSRQRKPNSDAIADLAVANFIEMRDLVGQESFLIEKKIERRLSELYPDEFQSVYRLVSFSREPYSKAWQQRSLERELLEKIRLQVPNIDVLDKKNARPYFDEFLAKVAQL